MEWKYLSNKISFCKSIGDGWADTVKIEALELVVRALEQQESLEVHVDAVPIVRCRDCVMFEIVEYYGGGEKQVCRLFDRSIQLDDFCSYAQRKEGDK